MKISDGALSILGGEGTGVGTLWSLRVPSYPKCSKIQPFSDCDSVILCLYATINNLFCKDKVPFISKWYSYGILCHWYIEYFPKIMCFLYQCQHVSPVIETLYLGLWRQNTRFVRRGIHISAREDCAKRKDEQRGAVMSWPHLPFPVLLSHSVLEEVEKLGLKFSLRKGKGELF